MRCLIKNANVEHRTLNVQHRIMYSVNLKKRLSKSTSPDWLRRPRANMLFETFPPGGICGSLVLRSIKRSVVNIQRSMFDVRCSTFSQLAVPTRRNLIRSFIWGQIWTVYSLAQGKTLGNRATLGSRINPEPQTVFINYQGGHTFGTIRTTHNCKNNHG